MAKGLMIGLGTKSMIADEAEFNRWSEAVHNPEMMALDGFKTATRYIASSQQLFPGSPPFQYMTIYELDDIQRALTSLAEKGARLATSDSYDPSTATVIIFEESPSGNA